jgi:hypothetical protein
VVVVDWRPANGERPLAARPERWSCRTIDSYLRIGRQVERIAKLNQQLAAVEKAGQTAK